jgi:ATP adenylyltransferase
MAVPREHRLALAGALPAARSDLVGLVARAQARLRKTFGPAALFEHGAYEPQSTFGCGIDHAHLHLVPLSFDLAELVVGSERGGRWSPSGPPWARTATGPYLTVSSDGKSWWTATPKEAPRQFFRSVIAAAIGLDERYDYDEYPFRINATTTVNAWFSQGIAPASSVTIGV